MFLNSINHFFKYGDLFDKERILEDMSVADILSELVYKDERVAKFIYFHYFRGYK